MQTNVQQLYLQFLFYFVPSLSNCRIKLKVWKLFKQSIQNKNPKIERKKYETYFRCLMHTKKKKLKKLERV